MSEPYEEIIHGETLQRRAPNPRHEAICERLHARLTAALAGSPGLRLSSPRALLELSPGVWLHPDLTLFDTADKKPYLVAEVIDSRDHSPDTVIKKRLYESAKTPRLWMIDPRYNNAETYKATTYGLSLLRILAGRECLRDDRLPELSLTIDDLFA